LAIAEQQKMAMIADRDVDMFGFYREENLLALQLFTMREGKVVGRREFFWEDLDAENFDVSEFLGEVLSQYYSTDYVPLEIHVPADFADRETLEQVLTERRGRKGENSRPERGTKARYDRTRSKTTRKSLLNNDSEFCKPDSQKVLEDLQEILELPYFPERIESFDISNIQGAENVAGIVVYENGKPARAEYRRLIIKTVEGANDFASMNEAVFRRYKRLLNEEKPLPQLIFIDGGKGQISAAAAALQTLDLEAIPIVGLVKPPKHHNQISHLLRFGYEENPIYFEAGQPVFRFVQQIRDETHKTAIQYHRKRREMRDFTSELTAIPKVGEKRKLKLLRNFGSIERIAKATVEELSPFLGAKAAKEVFEHFEKQRNLAAR
jgi:excinuclease ABC subunit C